MVQWASRGKAATDESTPIMHPVRMELAPHVRLGRRVNASMAIFVLMIFHGSILAVGILNWESACEGRLALFLIIYGGIGLLFVYLLFREWLYYARLSSLPTMTNLVLLIVFYVCLCVAGGFLTWSTIALEDTCRNTAPLLYRWAYAAMLFFLIIFALALLVPSIRFTARCVLAPVALCMIGCVETVGVDVEVGQGSGRPSDEAGMFEGGGGGGGGGGGDGVGSASLEDPNPNAELYAAIGKAIALPFVLVFGAFTMACSPFKPVAMGCKGFMIQLGGAIGCISISEFGEITCNLFNVQKCGTCLCNPTLLTGVTQAMLAPGCVVPGRSLIALFVNTAALLWFFLYICIELFYHWEIVCPSRDPGAPFQTDPFGWLQAGAPSPIHWLLLLFAVAGVILVILNFLSELFSGPKPPPRSHYEATLWRGKRQLKVLFATLLAALVVGWAVTLAWFTITDEECSTSESSLYKIAMLLLLLMGALLALVAFLGCCVTLDCFLSGRAKLILQIKDKAPFARPSADMYDTPPEADATLQAGVPPREPTSYGSADDAYFVGAVDDGPSKLCYDDAPIGTKWTSPSTAPARRV